MSSETVMLREVLEAVESLRAEVAGLNQRLATVEATVAASPAPAAAPQPEHLSEELVLTISAAIAAYLGAKPRIRQIRLLASPSWAQQGRATIQASHLLSVQHG